MRDLVEIVVAVLAVGVSFLGALRPVVMVRWVRGLDPAIKEDDRRALWTARLVCVGGLGVGLLYLAAIVRSFLNR